MAVDLSAPPIRRIIEDNNSADGDSAGCELIGRMAARNCNRSRGRPRLKESGAVSIDVGRVSTPVRGRAATVS